MTSDNAGNFVVAWVSSSEDGDADGVFASVTSNWAGRRPAPTLSWRVLSAPALALVGFGARVLSRRRRHA
ncbi:MAG TPA: hypothetical protein VLU24_11835 [Mycobacterium sp.]|nr:hypothetical protein [Mycobacterium sp.]